MLTRLLLVPTFALLAIACSASADDTESTSATNSADSKGPEAFAKPGEAKPGDGKPADDVKPPPPAPTNDPGTKPPVAVDPPVTVNPGKCEPHGTVSVTGIGFVASKEKGGICTSTSGASGCTDTWGEGETLEVSCAGEYHLVARAMTSTGCEAGDSVVIARTEKDGETIKLPAFTHAQSPIFPPLDGTPNACLTECAAKGGTISVSIDVQGESADGVFVVATAVTGVAETPCNVAQALLVHSGAGTGKF